MKLFVHRATPNINRLYYRVMYNNLLTDWRGCNGWGRKATSFLGNSDLSIIPWRSGRAYKFKFPSEYYCRPHWLLVNGRQNHNSQNFFSDTVKLYVKHSTAPLTVLGDNKSSLLESQKI